jgi:hypothetical protein
MLKNVSKDLHMFDESLKSQTALLQMLFLLLLCQNLNHFLEQINVQVIHLYLLIARYLVGNEHLTIKTRFYQTYKVLLI